jgi:putative Holliday junction resolvase
MTPPDQSTTARIITSIVGFDFGKKRIGVATGQMITRSATPLKTIDQVEGNPDWSAIESELLQYQPQVLVVGMPYDSDGDENKMTAAVDQFCYELEKRFKLPVEKVNEAFSSQQAEEILRSGMKINQHNKHEIDRMAAAIIVQRWIDNQN